MLVFVLVSEDNLGERCTSSAIVHDVPDNSLDVAGSFGVVKSSEAGGCNSLAGVCFEDGATSVTLC